jgi:hypothetical protein
VILVKAGKGMESIPTSKKLARTGGIGIRIDPDLKAETGQMLEDKENKMPLAKSISLNQFTGSVQAAVKAAVQKHPKFKMEAPNGVVLSYFIRGIPVPDNLLANITVGETQAFANEIAGQIGGQEGLTPGHAGGQGVVYSHGTHVIVGIPPIFEPALFER